MSVVGDVDLLWEDGPCLVFLKPSGLLTQAPPGIDSLETRIKRWLMRRGDLTAPPYLAIIHRLDRPASGVILFATKINAARKLSLQFEHREVEKRYWALVEGRVVDDSGRWVDWMRKVEGEPRSEICDPAADGAQEARLAYRVVRRFDDATLLEIELETGRTHQIRLQASSHGHPLLGDSLYGSRTPFGPDTPDERARWIALHARSLSFVHPVTKERVSISAPPSWATDAGEWLR